MRSIYIILTCFSLFIISCGNNNNEKTPVQDTATPPVVPTQPVTSNLSEAGTKKLVNVLNSYYALKEALVATSLDKAIAEAKTLSGNIDNLISNNTGNDSSVMAANKNNIDTIRTFTASIASSNGEKIDKIRTRFSRITGPLYSLCKTAGLKNANIYLAHCPMALNDTGANWLSNYAEIKNPYFGDKMLECGDVEDSLK